MCLYSDALEKKLQLETQPALQDYFTSQPFLYVFIILSKNQSEWTFDFLISPFLGELLLLFSETTCSIVTDYNVSD